MNATAPQPGPWHLRETLFGPAVDSEIGMVTGPIGLSEQKLATAQLIAAAPELLAACVRAGTVLAHHVEGDGSEMCAMAEALCELRAAIAKAKSN